MNKYAITLKHDDGVVRIVTVGRSLTAAIRSVLLWELAPFSAITRLEKLS